MGEGEGEGWATCAHGPMMSLAVSVFIFAFIFIVGEIDLMCSGMLLLEHVRAISPCVSQVRAAPSAAAAGV